MSTHIRPRADPDPRTETRLTEEKTDDRDATDDASVTDAAHAAHPAENPTESGVNRCQRQFSAADTRRLRNLADEANESMPNPE